MKFKTFIRGSPFFRASIQIVTTMSKLLPKKKKTCELEDLFILYGLNFGLWSCSTFNFVFLYGTDKSMR